MSTDHPSIDELPMTDVVVEPKRPDVTPIGYAAIVGVVIQFARAFGIWDASEEQADALLAACALLGTLAIGDTVLRGFRNLARR